jgi:Fe-S oxidoreductase
MCPTFLATGDEIMSTRGRANIIRAALDLRVHGHDPLKSDELDAALSNCLSCKGCTPECPSNVNLALLKAELTHARYERDGLPLRVRVLSDVDLLGKIGCAVPMLANAALDSSLMRKIMRSFLGLTARRPLPHYVHERFDRWFERTAERGISRRGKVILWDDTFVRYNEAHIGVAAVKVLQALGFEVTLPTKRTCCGRPAFSLGNLKEAARVGRHNLDLLGKNEPDVPILFLEPSCYSMFAEDYRELQLPNTEQIAKRCFLFEKFVDDLLEREPQTVRFNEKSAHIAIHAHCHAKSILNPAFMARLAQRLPGRRATLLDTGCCGMAGAFGALESKYELSLKVGADLVKKIQVQPSDSIVVASGTSCRHQIEHLMPIYPKHMAEVLADAIV